MTVPSAAEVEVAGWPALKAYAVGLGLNPKGRSGIVRRRVLDHVRGKAGTAEWRAGKAEQAALLTRLGLGDAAAQLWESTISLDVPAPWVGLGTAYLRAGRAEEAMKCFDRAIGLGDPGARLHKARALLDSGRGDDALAEVGGAIAANARDVRAWVWRASLAEAGGRTDEALAAFATLADLGRGRPGLARHLMKAGRYEVAGKALEAHLAERPGDGVAWNNLGACHAKRGLWEQALAAFRRAAEIDPRDAGVQNNLAVALAATGKAEEAMKRLQAARRIAEDPRILLNEAALMERQRAPAAARETYARVLAVAPAHPEAVAGKRRVAPRRGAPATRAKPVRPARRVVPRPHPKPATRIPVAKKPGATKPAAKRPKVRPARRPAPPGGGRRKPRRARAAKSKVAARTPARKPRPYKARARKPARKKPASRKSGRR